MLSVQCVFFFLMLLLLILKAGVLKSELEALLSNKTGVQAAHPLQDSYPRSPLAITSPPVPWTLILLAEPKLP